LTRVNGISAEEYDRRVQDAYDRTLAYRELRGIKVPATAEQEARDWWEANEEASRPDPTPTQLAAIRRSLAPQRGDGT